MEDFAKRLRQAMEIRDMKQSDLIEKTGINKGALSSYLSGRYNPKQDNIFLLAKALDVNEVWLMGADVPMNKPVPKALEDLAQEHVEEQKLLGYFRQLNEEGKIQALAMMKSLSEMEPFREEDAASSDQTSTA